MSARSYDPAGRNKRSVWTITAAPFKGAHFAAFPPKLVEPCVLAGTSERGVCPNCAAPWERVTKTNYRHHEKWFGDKQAARHSRGSAGASYNEPIGTETIGWRPTCFCAAGAPIAATVLDPFGGAGTTGLVAARLGRDAVLFELNPGYAAMAAKRIGAAVSPVIGHADKIGDRVDDRRLDMQPPRLEQTKHRGKADPPIGPAEFLVKDQGAGAVLVHRGGQRAVAREGLIALEDRPGDLAGAAQRKPAIAAKRAIGARPHQVEL
jgi:hypothetical protein